ncbi:septation protein SepH [Nocardioides sp.]|uniref:septation protein SepH n=1 Tax=Nocardioides sp. TaxID=35761 RepID=UPI003518FA3A
MTENAEVDAVVTPVGRARAHAPSPLRFVGLSEDGRRVLLQDEHGAPYTLDLTPPLQAAVRGVPARAGQLETTMDRDSRTSSDLRPRDIQARIRAGETPESVAAAAGVAIERVMPFAGPVLAEREHIAERAQRAHLRRPAGEGAAGGARVLADAVAAHLRGLDINPASVTWDAWRREDGRWTLTADYTADYTAGGPSGERTGLAHFTYDAPGNYVLLADDDARWLVGELPPEPAAEPARDDLASLRERRTQEHPAPAPSPQQALEQAPVDVVAAPEAAPAAERAGEPVVPAQAARPAPVARTDQPTADDVLPWDDEPAPSRPADAPAASTSPAPGTVAADEPSTEEPPARKPARKKGRASVPSWDEIMFGGGDRS